MKVVVGIQESGTGTGMKAEAGIQAREGLG